MQYAFPVMAVCAVGYVLSALIQSWWISLAVCIVLLTLILLAISRRAGRHSGGEEVPEIIRHLDGEQKA